MLRILADLVNVFVGCLIVVVAFLFVPIYVPGACLSPLHSLRLDCFLSMHQLLEFQRDQYPYSTRSNHFIPLTLPATPHTANYSRAAHAYIPFHTNTTRLTPSL